MKLSSISFVISFIRSVGASKLGSVPVLNPLLKALLYVASLTVLDAGFTISSFLYSQHKRATCNHHNWVVGWGCSRHERSLLYIAGNLNPDLILGLTPFPSAQISPAALLCVICSGCVCSMCVCVCVGVCVCVCLICVCVLCVFNGSPSEQGDPLVWIPSSRPKYLFSVVLSVCASLQWAAFPETFWVPSYLSTLLCCVCACVLLGLD